MEMYDVQIASWLAITPLEMPADFYRWLGVRLFETNPTVISQGYADRLQQIAAVGATGEILAQAQMILKSAYDTLYDPSRRAAYDQWLASQAVVQ